MLRNILILSIFILIGTVISCSGFHKQDHALILNQIQDNEGVYIVPELFMDIDGNFKKLVSFDSVAAILAKEGLQNNEENFFIASEKLNARYIIVPSQYIENGYKNFDWIVGKNFMVCPGSADESKGEYFVLLVWDNTKQTFHFFKFLYYP